MIVCPACGVRNPEDAQVCEGCSASLDHFAYRACPSCDALNPAQNLFCHRCFTELVPSARGEAAPVDEWVPPALPRPVAPVAKEPESGQVPTIEEADDFAQSEELVDRGDDVAVAPAAGVLMPESGEGFDQTIVAVGEADRAEESVEDEGEGVAEAEAPVVEFLEPRPLMPSEEPVVTGEAEELESEAAEEALSEMVLSPLAGLGDLLPLETAVSLPHRAEPLIPQDPAEAERLDAELFQRIAKEPAPLYEPARAVVPRKVRLLPRMMRVVLYVLVLLAALAPSFTGGQTASWVTPRRSVVDLANTFGGLAAGSVVLISFDYSAAYAGEMDALALALVRQLAERSVHMVAMSTDPAGVGVAERIYHTLASEAPDYRYGQEYALLGYLPGQQAGVRALTHNLSDAFKVDHVERRALSELPVTRGLATLQDIDHVVVLADDSQSVRYWIEQVQARSGIDLHALVSARIEPALVPYQQSGQLRSLVGAAQGAAEYEVASGGRRVTLGSTDGYVALFLVLLLTGVVTNVAYVSGGEGSRSQGG